MLMAASMIALTAVAARAQTPASCVTGVDLATLGSTSIVGSPGATVEATGIGSMQSLITRSPIDEAWNGFTPVTARNRMTASDQRSVR